jgi:hypothetical protein
VEEKSTLRFGEAQPIECSRANRDTKLDRSILLRSCQLAVKASTYGAADQCGGMVAVEPLRHSQISTSKQQPHTPHPWTQLFPQNTRECVLAV